MNLMASALLWYSIHQSLSSIVAWRKTKRSVVRPAREGMGRDGIWQRWYTIWTLKSDQRCAAFVVGPSAIHRLTQGLEGEGPAKV